MLVFGSLKRRKFQRLKDNAKDDATGVFYTSGVCSGATCSRTLFRIYIHSAWVSLCSFSLNGFSYDHKLRTGKGSDTHVFCFVASNK